MAHERDPMKSVQWLVAYLVKWPAVDGPDTDARDHIQRLIDAFLPLNEQATKGEVEPGFWGGFAARCQNALKDVKAQTEALIAGLEGEEIFEKQQHELATGDVPRHIRLRAQHAVAVQVLEWLGRH